MIEIGKKVFYVIWGIIIIYLLYEYLKNPTIASPNNIRNLVREYSGEMMLTYITLSLIRGFFLSQALHLLLQEEYCFRTNYI